MSTEVAVQVLERKFRAKSYRGVPAKARPGCLPTRFKRGSQLSAAILADGSAVQAVCGTKRGGRGEGETEKFEQARARTGL